LCDELRALVGLGVRHLSIYALTIEPDTMWPKLVQKGQRELPDADRQADCLQAVERELTRAGLEHYEVASYARSKADRSQHNLRYWSWSDYIGLGPSAASATFGRDGTVTRRTNVRGLAKWIARPEQADVETLGAERAAAEGLWLGLRRLDGFRIEDFLARFTAVDRRWVENRVADQLARGNLEWVRTDRLRVTPQRWLFHDEICAALL
jgi:oxygen-independent coproporphyrinogen-3 oxidase